MANAANNPDRILGGIGLRLFAILCLASMAALIKLGEARGTNLIETMFFRQACAVPLVVGFMAAGPGFGALRTERPGAHLMRTAVGIAGMFANFGAIMLLPLAEAQTLAFTAPIFATVLGALILHESTGWHRWAAVLTGFGGVLIVVQPGGGAIPLFGAIVGVAAAFFVALIAILLRQIGKTEGAITTVFWFSTLSVPPLGLAYLWHLQPHDALTWAILVAIGIVSGLGQLSLTAALRLAPVSVVVPMDYSGLVWATIYGWLLFGMWPTPATWIGAPIIIGSGLYIVAREHRLKRLRAAQAT